MRFGGSETLKRSEKNPGSEKDDMDAPNGNALGDGLCASDLVPCGVQNTIPPGTLAEMGETRSPRRRRGTWEPYALDIVEVGFRARFPLIAPAGRNTA